MTSPDNSNLFSSLELSEDLIQVVSELGFEKMTPIQAQSIPLLLKGKDLIGQSKTGSGKTASFALPILQKIDMNSRDVQALIICPTRELCTQVAREIRRLARRHPGLQALILTGGQPGRPQAEALYRGAHIVVGTPGRILDHIRRGNLTLAYVKTLVLDEADRMLEMGFEEDMSEIMDEAPRTRQTVLFSATFPPQIKSLSGDYQYDPAHVVIESEPEAKANIEQIAYGIEEQDRVRALIKILQIHQPESAIVFVNLKVSAAEIEEVLKRQDLSVESLHGDLLQEDRDRVMAKFRNGSTRILVATDVAARGLDIDDLKMVINFELPKQAEVYVHRIGRTGRAGRSGIAVSLASPNETLRLHDLKRELGFEIEFKVLANEHVPRAQQATLLREAGEASMKTLFIGAGRKDKLRPGDIMGALTKEAGFQGSDIGKIEIHDRFAYVAVAASIAEAACTKLRDGRIKGLKLQIKIVR